MAMAPVVFINVFDPATHKTARGLVRKPLLRTAGPPWPTPAWWLPQWSRIRPATPPMWKTRTTPWTVLPGVIDLEADGAIEAGATVAVDYEYGDPSKVTAEDVIGGIDGSTGKKKGLELVDDVFPRFRLVPGLVCAPGFSQDPTVGAE